MDQDLSTIVIDNGSSVFKAGLAGDEAPKVIIPAAVGRSKYAPPYEQAKNNFGDLFFGSDILLSPDLKLHYPIERGIVKNWDFLEKLYHNIFYKQLKLNPEEHPVLLTVPTLTPDRNREAYTQIMFETFNVPSIYIGDQASLSLYSSGRDTGIICEVGDDLTQILCKYEKKIIKYTNEYAKLGGQDINQYLEKQMQLNHGVYADTSNMKESIRKMKEELCYVALDYAKEVQKTHDASIYDAPYTFPNGQRVIICKERFECGELLFRPNDFGIDTDGIAQMIFNNIKKCDDDLQRDLFSNIVLSGGATMMKGFPERVENEIIKLSSMLKKFIKIKVVAPPEMKFGCWIGGSIFASLAPFPSLLLTKENYNENGPGMANKLFK
ncbi:hypothetical protein M9Y10_026856 [Tritrichomonas musculus]|uniref:Actin n=1 Tax=Tritrichomonas musculus TaxID=1915356 RepID=A0ABR2H6Q2_9EUKA